MSRNFLCGGTIKNQVLLPTAMAAVQQVNKITVQTVFTFSSKPFVLNELRSSEILRCKHCLHAALRSGKGLYS